MNAPRGLVLRHRAAAIGFVVLMTAAALVGITQLEFDDSYQDVFRSPDARYASLRRLAETFGAGDDDAVLLIEGPDVLSRPALEAMRAMHASLTELPGVEMVTSLHSARKPRRVGRLFLPLFPTGKASDDDYETARREALVHPLVVGVLLASDQSSALIVVRLRDGKDDVQRLEPRLFELRRLAQAEAVGTGLTVELTGMPAIRVESIRRLQREHFVISAAGATLATLVAWLLLRRLPAVVLVVLPALVGVVWTLGIMGLAGRHLNAINIVLPALVMVIGVADSTHLVFHYRDHLAAGGTPGSAVSAAISELFGACSLTALTTSIGFLSLLVADDRIIGEFGISGGVGVLLTFMAVMTLLPLLCETGLGRIAPTGPRHEPRGPAWPDWWLDRIEPRAPALLGLLLVSAFLLAIPLRTIEADYHFLENLTESSESYRAMRRLERQFGGGRLLQVLVEWPAGHAWRSPETLQLLAEIHETLETNPVTSHPISVRSLLSSLPGSGGDLSTRWGELALLPPERVQALVREDRQVLLVSAQIPDAGAAALRRPLDELDAALRAIGVRYPALRIELTGFAVVSTYRASAMILDLFEGLSLEVVVIFVVLSLALRSALLGGMSLPSNLFPLLATAALIVVTGLSLQYSTVLALNICLGIAVDDTIHFLSRYRRELALGHRPEIAARLSFRAVAPVMGTSTLLMLSGFGAGIGCSIPTVRAFSLCSCLALIFAVASEGLVLPALLFSWARLQGAWHRHAGSAN